MLLKIIGVYWILLENCRSALEIIAVHWIPLEVIRVHWCPSGPLEPVGDYRSPLESIGVHWSVLECIGERLRALEILASLGVTWKTTRRTIGMCLGAAPPISMANTNSDWHFSHDQFALI